MSSKYEIRNMQKNELKFALKLAKIEGWNPGLHDAECFYALDPKGFFIGLLEDKPISCISAVSLSSEVGFLGLYIVKKEHRKKGYGLKLWNHVTNILKNKNIGLDGVVEQQPNYKKSGFKFVYNNIRFKGKSKNLNFKNPNIHEITSIPFDHLVEYDAKLNPSSRADFLNCWIKQPDSFSFGFMKNNELKGYGMIRKCVEGYKVGPLFADNEKIAENLLKKLISSLDNNTIFYIDVPQPNSKAMELVNKFKTEKVFETARMYTHEPPKLNLNKIFGVTTLEIG